jgi:hypothetical protein
MGLNGITEVLAIKGFVAVKLDVGEDRADIWLDAPPPVFSAPVAGSSTWSRTIPTR